MTRQEAIALAQAAAKAKPESYYSEPFQPHEWVIDAILMAAKAAIATFTPENPHIRMVSHDGDLRVTAPAGRKSNAHGLGAFYVNNVLVIEKAGKTSLGEPTWHSVGDRLVDNAPYPRGIGVDTSVHIPRDQFNAIFKLLARSDR